MKNILFLAPDFYKYWVLIKQALEREDCNVDTIIYPNSFIYKLCTILPITRRLKQSYDDNYYRKKISKCINTHYDRVIIIKSSTIPTSILKELKN